MYFICGIMQCSKKGYWYKSCWFPLPDQRGSLHTHAPRYPPVCSVVYTRKNILLSNLQTEIGMLHKCLAVTTTLHPFHVYLSFGISNVQITTLQCHLHSKTDTSLFFAFTSLLQIKSGWTTVPTPPPKNPHPTEIKSDKTD